MTAVSPPLSSCCRLMLLGMLFCVVAPLQAQLLSPLVSNVHVARESAAGEAGSAAGAMVLAEIEADRGNTHLIRLDDVPMARLLDTKPPTLGAAISITPGTVDISAADQTVTVNVQLLDSDGVASTSFFLQDSDTGAGAFGFAARVTGTPQNGTWRASITIPRYATAGQWRLFVYTNDTPGNVAYHDTGRSLVVPPTRNRSHAFVALPPLRNEEAPETV